MRMRRTKGFTLIELLIVIAILGIIAAIIIPYLLDALQKSKQKRTLSDMRNTGTAWMSWLVDQVGAASAGSAKTYDSSGFNGVSYVEMVQSLTPSNTFYYMQEVPELDGWHYPFTFARNSNLLLDRVLAVCSGGRDAGNSGIDCAGTFTVGPFHSTDYDQDMVWADGYFVRWPSFIDNSGSS